MQEQELYTVSDGHRLAGTLCLPDTAGPHAVVLMVHGSGPLDRNENLAGQALNAFNSIARYLAQRGIASLRYDKRGCGKSAGNFAKTGHLDLVNDALSWLTTLAAHKECQRDALFVLGHSEGAVIAPQIARRWPAIAGQVLLCPFIENLETVLLRQARQIERELTHRRGISGILAATFFRSIGVSEQGQKKLIARIHQSKGDTLRVRLQKLPARWYRELFALDMPAIYRGLSCPTLLLGGAKDLQCQPQDIHEIAALLTGPVTAEVIPDLTHLLRMEAGEASLTSSSRLLRKPVEPLVIEAVAIWLQEQLHQSAA